MHSAHPHSSEPDRSPTTHRRLNLGVLAHVDAGKTSLTEALLHAGGALAHTGRVDDGTTTTDTLALEHRRGITIRTAVAGFTVGEVEVNLIDTPGHPDFIAEVDRSLVVLDAAILVVSAVEGVQAQTIVLYRALRRLGIPIMFFVNKIDRSGADPDRVVHTIKRRLTDQVIVLGAVDHPGTPAADFVPFSMSDPTLAQELTAAIADHEPTVLRAWVEDGTVLDAASFSAHLRTLSRRSSVQPLSMGSAITGAGIDGLIKAVTSLFPITPPSPAAPMSGQVFKIERSPSGRICYIRLRTGTIMVRDHLTVGGAEVGRVTALEVCEPEGFLRRDRAAAGQVIRIHGCHARLGDQLGTVAADAPRLHFSPPAWETTVTTRDPDQGEELHRALTEIADFDPLIRVRPDDTPGALRISIYGEVQQQVIADTLELDFGIEVDFRSTTIVCVERPLGTGHAVRRMSEPDQLLPYTLGVDVAANRPGAGVVLNVDVPRTSLPLHIYSTVEAFHDALLEYAERPLASGPHGWQVVDVVITVTESAYAPPNPPPAAVRNTVEIVVAEAMRRAGTLVCEPIEAFRLEAPADSLAAVLGLLTRHRAEPGTPEISRSLAVLTGMIPTAELDAVRRGLHNAAHGEGVLESQLDHYVPAAGRHPDHLRTGR